MRVMMYLGEFEVEGYKSSSWMRSYFDHYNFKVNLYFASRSVIFLFQIAHLVGVFFCTFAPPAPACASKLYSPGGLCGDITFYILRIVFIKILLI